ncbi:protein ZAR1-like isoform X2 [Cavia porcellus]|uniref:protein ZAR1-like isoform X2 n=1 Tax=Cavia porcellus TaxID=10141 RepID=UPI002FE2405B
MERFVRVPCVWYQDCGNTLPVGQSRLSRHCQPTWRQNMGPPTFLARPGLLVPANAPEYWVNPYRRAHFEPILTPMNPNLCQRLCKANTKEVGVQVSLRVDKAIQCSLGPQTLHSCCPWDNASHRKAMPHWGVYSQLIGRRGYAWLRKDEENGKSKVLLGPGKASQQPPPMPVSEDEKQDELPRSQELVEEDAKHLGEGKDMQVAGDAGDCPPQKPSFQSLEPKYGYFHCKDCNIRWESAYVWCISGTNKVYFKQLCSKCQKSFNPYRVEAIHCQILWPRYRSACHLIIQEDLVKLWSLQLQNELHCLPGHPSRKDQTT